jgi:hypothetical protein
MRESDARRRRRSLLATARLLLVVRLEVRAALPRSRECKLGADGSISVYAASPRQRRVYGTLLQSKNIGGIFESEKPTAPRAHTAISFRLSVFC